MSRKLLVRMFASACLLVIVSACGGGGADITNDSTTTGQELLDLQKARDSGAISEKEYQKQREKALDRD